jgi:glycosyltransferase involved in cell wall biosynthesis
MSASDFDLCLADFLVAVPNVPKARTMPVVLFEHNIEYVIWKRLAAVETRPLHKAILELEWRKVRRFEADACATADLTIAVSDEDRRGLQSLAPGGRIVATPTGVDTDFFTPGQMPEIPHHLVFSGSMDWYPNEDAILHFGEHILPLIRARVPDVTVTVVGRNPTAALRAAAGTFGIVLTGTVDDVRPYIDRASVYIVPLRAGGGTRLKIFEALAMRKAVVSTAVGAEGLALTDDRDVVIADEPNAFAEAVIRLFEDPFRRESIARAGRELVETLYSWDRVTDVFENYCLSALATRQSALGTRHLGYQGGSQ